MIVSFLFVFLVLCCVSGIIDISPFLEGIHSGFINPSFVLGIMLAFLFILFICSVFYWCFECRDCYSRLIRGRAGTDDKYYVIRIIVVISNYLFGYFLLGYYLYCNF